MANESKNDISRLIFLVIIGISISTAIIIVAAYFTGLLPREEVTAPDPVLEPQIGRSTGKAVVLDDNPESNVTFQEAIDAANQRTGTLEVQVSDLEKVVATLSEQIQQGEESDEPVTEEYVANPGVWEIEYFSGVTELMKNFVFTPVDQNWAEFPNVDYGDFVASNGLEFGQELSVFCQQEETCDVVVAARSYRSITGDYDIDGIGACSENGSGIGCMVLIFNVGDFTASWEDSYVDAGHTVSGLYWNGNENDQAISALASHLAYKMIGPVDGMPSNPGANCGVPDGCEGVDITFAITSGLEVLVLGHTVVQ